MPESVSQQTIGVLTLPLTHNYGGILQFIALQQVLTSFGYNTLLLDFQPSGGTAKAWLKSLLFQYSFRNIDRFKKRYVVEQTEPIYTVQELRKVVLDRQLAAVIVGSDQVWQERFTQGNLGAYFLHFLKDDSVPKVAYAASFGTTKIETPIDAAEISEALQTFTAISVREDSGKTILADVFGYSDATHVLDPTLLLPASFYESLISEGEIKTSNPGLFAYVLDETDELRAQIDQFAESNNLSVSEIKHRSSTKIGQLLQQKPLVEQWLYEFKNAKFVVTDSYHGMLLSIIFEKQFLVVVNKKRGAARFESLARLLGLEDRLLNILNSENIQSYPIIDYSDLDSLLNVQKEASSKYLKSNLPTLF